MKIRLAQAADLEQLLALRLALFADLKMPLSPEQEQQILQANRDYFTQYLDSPASRTWVADVGGQLVSVGTLALYVRAPHPRNLTGKEAYLLNMFTVQGFRGQGAAKGIVQAAKDFAFANGYPRIGLHTSVEGKPLYVGAGFVEIKNFMEVYPPA
ncbi:MAG: hypothetical protein RL748_1363 [Pseudomonadota bacterium]|jgi:GNAT superfamily N-acetyltransferase